MSTTRTAWSVKASDAAMRTSNPIRQVVDQMRPTPNPDKPFISLSIGDPTVFGNLVTPENVTRAVQKATESNKYNGYAHSCGYTEARAAIAEKFSVPNAKLTADDVIIASACSGAIELAITALANPGDNILMPRPGFGLYQTICDSKGIEARFYNLLPERKWEVDVNHLRTLIDDKTRAIIVNNPSNPCGCVYTRDHLLEILKVADEFCVPIIADEIYADMVFEGHTFHPLASLTNTVPILSVGGLAKQYLVPGWRVGWILIFDRPLPTNDGEASTTIFSEVRQGLLRLSTLILGANTLVQGAIPEILTQTPEAYYKELNATLQRHAAVCVEKLSSIPGLRVIEPQGAMYVMIGVDLDKFSDIADDMSFCRLLMNEESVFVLPGRCFGTPSFFRIVTTAPIDTLTEALDRIAAFCTRHSQ